LVTAHGRNPASEADRVPSRIAETFAMVLNVMAKAPMSANGWTPCATASRAADTARPAFPDIALSATANPVIRGFAVR
jgi:hypothetical protein